MLTIEEKIHVTNKRLNEDEELSVRLYLDRLEAISTAARKQVIGCANDIFRRSFTSSQSGSDTRPPEVCPLRTQRFLERHPEYKVRRQHSNDSNKKVHTIRRYLGVGSVVTKHYSSIAEVSGHPIALTLGLALIIHPLLAPSRGLGLSVVRLLLQLTSSGRKGHSTW